MCNIRCHAMTNLKLQRPVSRRGSGPHEPLCPRPPSADGCGCTVGSGTERREPLRRLTKRRLRSESEGEGEGEGREADDSRWVVIRTDVSVGSSEGEQRQCCTRLCLSTQAALVDDSLSV
jgi:hypothetical protein